MAGSSNVNRLPTAQAFAALLDVLVRLAGIVVQTHRAYESPSKGGRGLLQAEVAARAGVSKTVVSQLERGVAIPSNKVLRRILIAAGIRIGKGTAGHGFFKLLCETRRCLKAVHRLSRETPA